MNLFIKLLHYFTIRHLKKACRAIMFKPDQQALLQVGCKCTLKICKDAFGYGQEFRMYIYIYTYAFLAHRCSLKNPMK